MKIFQVYIYIYRSGILWRPPLANPFVGILRLDGAVPPNCQLRFYYTRVSRTRVRNMYKRIFLKANCDASFRIERVRRMDAERRDEFNYLVENSISSPIHSEDIILVI